MNPAHYDYDALADLAEGLLEDDQAASVNAHLDSCAECRDRSADLADVSRLLAEAPVPSMPAELASRIDSAIAAESLSAATVVDLEQRRSRRHWRILSAAAATVLVLGGGAMVGNMALTGDEPVAQMPPAADQPDHGDGPGEGDAEPGPLAAPEGGFSVVRSGTEYRSGTLDRQVGGTLERLGGASDEPARAPDARLTGCVSKVTGGQAPALVDEASYDGAPATVIAAKADAGTMDVWVVGPGCSAQDAKVLKHLTVDRN